MKVVVFHDSNLYRLTGIQEKIENLNYSELPTKFLEYISINYDNEPPLYTRDYDCRLPLLEEVIDSFQIMQTLYLLHGFFLDISSLS